MRHILVLFTLWAVGGFGTIRAEAAQPEYLDYEEFLRKVQANEVKSVSLGPLFQLEGTYSGGNDEKTFISVHPIEPANDPLLIELLEKHKVSVVQKELSKPGFLDRLGPFQLFLAGLGVLAVLLVFVLIYVVRINNKVERAVIR